MHATTSGIDPRLQLEPVSSRSRLWLLSLTVALPVLLSIVLPLLAGRDDAVSRFIDDSLLLTRILGPLLVTVVTVLIWVVLDRAMQRHRLQLDADGIEVVTTFYRNRIALSQLQLDAARVLDLGEHPELKPWLRTKGMSLPGFNSGWFRTRGWKKLFIATADGERLLWLPTTRGHALLLQPRQPQALLDCLRDMATAAPRR